MGEFRHNEAPANWRAHRRPLAAQPFEGFALARAWAESSAHRSRIAWPDILVGSHGPFRIRAAASRVQVAQLVMSVEDAFEGAQV
jgi:hypothetical protein